MLITFTYLLYKLNHAYRSIFIRNSEVVVMNVRDMSAIRIIVVSFLFQFTTADNFQTTLGHLKPQVSSEGQAKAVNDLIKRLVPSHAGNFIVKINSKIVPEGKDGFHIETLKNGTIQITGTTGVAAATGFHHYLKYYCHCHISWEGSQLNLPQTLPQVNVIISLNDRFRYYQNVCTPSYSFVWWDWPQWQKHIDWMAINSFNLVLAFNGQEAIWKKVYLKLGLTDEEINKHFAGPAFLSWGRMGNIRGWGGPLSAAWQNRSVTLQKQIVDRMRQLGMITVLPAFAGHVPRAFSRIYPDAKLVKVQKWNKFNDSYCCPYLLDPTDPVFKTVGTMFLSELISEFGTDHVYNCDAFNEMEPPSSNLSYLADTGKSVYNAMTSADSKAIWLLQGWMFYSEKSYWSEDKAESFLKSIPLGKMIVLDLQSEQFPQYDRLKSYFGQPYIWCMLHNFGGTLGMLGSSEIINSRIFTARQAQNSTLIGIGLTPEGINQNYVIYDLMIEMAWRKTPTNLTDWFAQYACRRYGKNDTYANSTMQILKNTVYNYSMLLPIRGKYAVTRAPSTKINTWTWYNRTELFDAWKYILLAAKALNTSELYQHDLVDITRQNLQNIGDICYDKIKWAFKKKNTKKLKQYSKYFLEVFDDLEAVLATNKAFLLGVWVESSKAAASDATDRKLFEFNARNQITLWGPQGEIKDYANKQWSGLVSDYYHPRWKLFLKLMNKSIAKRKPFKETKAQKKVFKLIEKPFTYDLKVFPTTPTGDTVVISQQIKDRWLPRMHKLHVAT